MLSVDEVTAAVGEDITGSTELPAGCQWTVGGAEGAWYDWQSFPAEVYIENRDNAADFGLEVETVDGLGDEAFRRLTVSPEGDELNGETWVLVGETGFQVRVSLMGWSEDLEVDQRALAELIAARL